ncbi:hypothetical protein MMC12_004617 [Toensbergia leucococca]|nr:hypothetical protein [Toensbergia leucococca]
MSLSTELPMEPLPRSFTTQLTPAPPAQFRGSFAAIQRSDTVRAVKELGIRSLVFHYLADDWNKLTIWRSAFIEFIATMSLCYTSALIDTTIANFQTRQLAAFVGISNIFLLSLFIYATAPSSGGHVNPLITFTTMLAGLIEFPRAILYMIGQMSGAAVAGGLIRGSFGRAMTEK